MKLKDVFDNYFDLRAQYIAAAKTAADKPKTIARLEDEVRDWNNRLAELEPQVARIRLMTPGAVEELCHGLKTAVSMLRSASTDLEQARVDLAQCEAAKRKLAKWLIEQATQVGKLLHADLAGVLGAEMKRASNEPTEVLELLDANPAPANPVPQGPIAEVEAAP